MLVFLKRTWCNNTVWNIFLSGISQRDYTQYYDHISKQKEDICRCIQDFFKKHIQYKFLDEDCEYFLVTQENEGEYIMLLDRVYFKNWIWNTVSVELVLLLFDIADGLHANFTYWMRICNTEPVLCPVTLAVWVYIWEGLSCENKVLLPPCLLWMIKGSTTHKVNNCELFLGIGSQLCEREFYTS